MYNLKKKYHNLWEAMHKLNSKYRVSYWLTLYYLQHSVAPQTSPWCLKDLRLLLPILHRSKTKQQPQKCKVIRKSGGGDEKGAKFNRINESIPEAKQALDIEVHVWLWAHNWLISSRKQRRRSTFGSHKTDTLKKLLGSPENTDERGYIIKSDAWESGISHHSL